ncbi:MULTISPECIES: hypothetical protein [unclassified Brenneria]|nr:hypothetical protein [Brenneria sp. L3-3C-1]MEE3642132.1 hypothetical protein [Brenneria sp. L3_3C_1]
MPRRSTRPTQGAQAPQPCEPWLSAEIMPLRGAFGTEGLLSNRQ